MTTLAEMTPEQRAEYVGGWVEDQAGNLRVYLDAIGVYENVTAYHDESTAHTWCPALRQFSRFGSNDNYTVRDDLPRAWTPQGEPVPMEVEYGEQHCIMPGEWRSILRTLDEEDLDEVRKNPHYGHSIRIARRQVTEWEPNP